MKLLLILTLGIQIASPAKDTVTLQMCTDSALKHHPSTAQLEMADRIAGKKRQKLQANFKPQVSLKGKATYQSDVVELPMESRRLQLPELPRDQYQGYAQVNQLLYDGGTNQSQKQLAELQASEDRKQVRQTHHQVENRVIQLYFSTLLTRKNKATIDSTLSFLRARYQSLQSALAKGVVTQKDLLLLETKMAELEQQRWKLKSRKQTAIQQLAHLTTLSLDSNTVFKIPSGQPVNNQQTIQRPRLKRLSVQQQQLMEQQKLTASKKRPKVSLFAQGGGGYPNPFNFFDNEFSPFYLVGLNVSWPLLDWGKTRNQREILHIRSQMLEQQKAAFKQEVETQLIRQQQEINNLKTLIRKDRQILEKKKRIRQIAANQLDRGTINTTDYLEHVNEAAQARLAMDKHLVELALAKRKYRHIQGE